MKSGILVSLALLLGLFSFAQNWNSYPAGAIGVPYVNGVMTATVTKVNTTMNSGTPMFTTSTSPDCYIAAGCLALNAGFFNSYLVNSSRIQVDLDFTTGGTNGTCNTATWTMRDINSGESFTDFLDVVEISGIDGNNVAIPTGNIVITNPLNTMVSVVGGSKKIVGHNSNSEVVTGGPYSSTPCNVTTVTVSPPANVTLKSIKIIYRPAVGTSSANAYYSVGTHPAVQYISISNLTLTPTGGGCSVLPASLRSFTGEPVSGGNKVYWATAEMENGLDFLVEKSSNGVDFSELGVVNGNASSNYSLHDASPFSQTYYRLMLLDQNGGRSALAMISVVADESQSQLFTLAWNPASARCQIQTLSPGTNVVSLHDLTGKAILENRIEGITLASLNLQELPPGIYIVKMVNAGNSSCKKLAIQK